MCDVPILCTPWFQLRWYERGGKVARLEDGGLEGSADPESVHYVNLASSYHHSLPPFTGNAPLTSNDIQIKQEYHASPSRTNGEPHNSTGAAYPMGESR